MSLRSHQASVLITLGRIGFATTATTIHRLKNKTKMGDIGSDLGRPGIISNHFGTVFEDFGIVEESNIRQCKNTVTYT